MSSAPDLLKTRAQECRKLLIPLFREAGLPVSSKDVAACLTRAELEKVAFSLGIQEVAESVDGLRGVLLDVARARVRREFEDLRHRAVSYMLSNNGVFPVISSLIAWGGGSAPHRSSTAGSSAGQADDSNITRGSSSEAGSSLDSAAATELADLRKKSRFAH